MGRIIFVLGFLVSGTVVAKEGKFHVYHGHIECQGKILNWDLNGSELDTELTHDSVSVKLDSKKACYQAAGKLMGSYRSHLKLTYHTRFIGHTNGTKQEFLWFTWNGIEFQNGAYKSPPRKDYPTYPSYPKYPRHPMIRH